MYSFSHCDVGGVRRAHCFLLHHIKEEVSVQEGLSGKVIRNIYKAVQVEEQCTV